jgi:ubiquitin carboxyl-terminal hydrolase 34
LKLETANAVRAMMVDEVEDDNSGKTNQHQAIEHGLILDTCHFLEDWEGSYISSDPLDCQPDLGVQQIGEQDEALAT